MKNLLFGFILGLLVIPTAAYTLITLGYAPVATASAPLPLEKWLARTAIRARILNEAPVKSPIELNEENLLAGARLYRSQCAVCHGLPNQQASLVAKGMFPRPPQLFHGHGVTDDPISETYWKVANGIRLTGMPGYQANLKEQELWQLSQVLASADKLPPNVSVILSAPLHIE
jgi:thiosulfate dehydrogenase